MVMVKGDWAELALTMGLPTWAHHAHPCFACKWTGGADGNMKLIQGVSVLGLPWAEKQMLITKPPLRIPFGP